MTCCDINQEASTYNSNNSYNVWDKIRPGIATPR